MEVKEHRNAIISVSNKEGLGKVAKFLISNNFRLFATSGTRSFLEKEGIDCESVEGLTGHPEILGGRVKTLSTSLLAGILAADRSDEGLRRFGYVPIDLVYVELYNFIDSFLRGEKDLTEFIDVGGVTMLRAAAKNYHRVIPVPGREAMEKVMNVMKDGNVPPEVRASLAGETFRLTSFYDYAISEWLGGSEGYFVTGGRESVRLRYGENPHQTARAYSFYPPFFDVIKSGKEVSFNNIIDAWAAWDLALRLGEGSASVVKHASPCGAATGPDSVKRAYESDPISAYGGILAYNGSLDEVSATFIKDKFLEVVIAGNYEEGARNILDKKKNLRLLVGKRESYRIPDIRSAGNVLLVQEWNNRGSPLMDIITGIPREGLIEDVRFGWEVVKSIKSNAVAIVKDKWLVSSCGGQPNRVDSVKIALDRAHYNDRLDPNGVLISDGFFPFPDSLEIADKSGIHYIAAPLGSIRDNEVLDYASGKGMTFIEIKERGFKH